MAIGYYSLGLTGYEIIDIEYGIEDKIKWIYVGTQREQIAHKSKVRTTAKGRQYFIAHGRRIYLDECMRTN